MSFVFVVGFDFKIFWSFLRRAYCVDNNPLYLNGDESEAQIYGKFLSAFEEGGDDEAKVTLEEFENYYSGKVKNSISSKSSNYTSGF